MSPSIRVRTAAGIIRGALAQLTSSERAQALALADATSNTSDDPRERIANALKATRGNITEASFVLGVARRVLQKKMRELGMGHGKRGRPAKFASETLTSPATPK